MSEKETHDACIGRAFNRRKACRQELAKLEEQAARWGEWMRVVSDRLRERVSYQVDKEHGILVFRRKTGTVAEGFTTDRVDEKPLEKPQFPTEDSIATIFNEMKKLREEIAELDTILAE